MPVTGRPVTGRPVTVSPAPGGGGGAVLRRALGLRTVVSTSTGLAFAALEYLAAAGLVAYVAGDSAWIAVGTAGLLALVAWGCFSELNGMFPTAAAIRLYMKRSMDDRVALTITFTYLTTIVLVIAADAFIVGSAIAHVLGQSSWVAALIIAALLGRGRAVQPARRQGGGRCPGRRHLLASSPSPPWWRSRPSSAATGACASPCRRCTATIPGDLLEAVALGVFLFSAFEWVTTSAEEVRRPATSTGACSSPWLSWSSSAASITVAMSHVLGHRQLVSAYPQLFLGRAAFGQAGLWLMAGGTAATAVNTFNGGFITASRFIYATAREGSLPSALARLNDRAVPWVPVVALGVVSLVVSLVVAATGSWSVLVAVGAALEAMIYAVAAFCVVRLRTRLPDQARPFRLPAPRLLGGGAIVVFGVLAAVASVSVANRFNLVPLVVIAAGAGSSALYVLAVLPRVKAADQARRAARGRRRPPPRPVGAPAAGDDRGR